MKKQTAEDTSINITIDQILNIIYANESNVNRYIRYKEFADIKTLLYKSQGCVYTAYVSKSIESKRLALVELNCKMRGDISLWDGLPSNKTLFKTNGIGLPIGNLTSQVFANVYMSIFDRWVISVIGSGKYGRYVDDFVIVHRDKSFLLSLIPSIRKFLNLELKLTLHPYKIYFQPVAHGVRFIGTIIHQNRRHTINRTVNSFYSIVESFNKSKIEKEKFIQKYNSYSGFLIHNMTYYIRRKAWDKIDDKRGITVASSFRYIKLKKNGKNNHGVERLQGNPKVRKQVFRSCIADARR